MLTSRVCTDFGGDDAPELAVALMSGTAGDLQYANWAVGWFDYVLPDTYVAGDGITVDIDIKTTGDADSGSNYGNYVTAHAVTFDGGSMTDAALSGTGDTFAAGTEVAFYVDQKANPTGLTQTAWLAGSYAPRDYTNVAVEAVTTTRTTVTLTIPGSCLDSGYGTADPGAGGHAQTNNVGGATLVDGSTITFGVAGEGYVKTLHSTPGTYNSFTCGAAEIILPVGGAVSVTSYPGSTGIEAGTVEYGPGDTISIMVRVYYYSSGVDGNTIIYGITVDGGDGDDVIDLATMRRFTTTAPIARALVGTVDPAWGAGVKPFFKTTL